MAYYIARKKNKLQLVKCKCKSYKCYVEQEKPDTKECLLYDSNLCALKGRWNLPMGKEIRIVVTSGDMN